MYQSTSNSDSLYKVFDHLKVNLTDDSRFSEHFLASQSWNYVIGKQKLTEEWRLADNQENIHWIKNELWKIHK